MTARDVVTVRMAYEARRFPDLDLSQLNTSELNPRDAGLALAIDHAVRRRWLTLASVCERRLTRRWDQLEPRIQAVLLVGAAQLLLLDRLPEHAVINEAVEWAKRHVRPKAGGLVNAVLHHVARLRAEKIVPTQNASPRVSFPLAPDELPREDGGWWKLTTPVFDDDPCKRLAQQTSHPDELISQWIKSFGQRTATMLAAHSLIQPPILLHGLNACGPEAEKLLQPHHEPGFWLFTGNREELQRLMQEQPGLIVQDPAAAAPVSASAGLFPPPRVIIDCCAGRGTKTRQLALLHPDSRIIATDINPGRLDALREQVAGHKQIEVVEHERIAEFLEQADLLLLDVPCSNTGVLARRVEAKYRFSPSPLEKLVNLQRQIIADSIPLLSPHGRLLYSTCSLEAAENEQQVQWIEHWHRLRVAMSRFRLPRGRPGDPPQAYSDGGYFAIVERG